MVQATRIWKCPALCGCELSITGRWVDDQPDDDGSGRAVSFRHPAPKSITNVTVVSVCAEHATLTSDPLPPDPYYGKAGYINPVPANPTPGERLYIHLYRYTGQTLVPDTCDCKLYQHCDRITNLLELPKRHHKHSRKCVHHQADDDAGTQARENSQRKRLIWDHAVTSLNKTELDFSWEYRTENGQRVLYFTIVGITANQQTQAQAWTDTNVGPGRVVVMRG